MNRMILLIPILLVVGAGLLPLPQSAAAASPYHLIVTPSQGHAGDPVYLSGGGFPRSAKLRTWTECGGRNFTGPRITTDAHGAFSGQAMRLPPAQHGRSRIVCFAVATTAGAGASISTKSEALTILPPTAALRPCTVHMCLNVQAFLVRLKNGAQGNIAISGWPGASIDLTVARVEAGSKYRHLHLNWQGTARVRMWVAPGLVKGVMAQVYVHARLGTVLGQMKAPFHVIPGGR